MKSQCRGKGRDTGFARLLVIVLLAITAPATAQGWKPDKTVEIIVLTTPGGGVDRTARLLQKILNEDGLIEMPVVVINKPGGGGAVAFNYLNQHPGDGHYIAISTPNLIANGIKEKSPIKYTDVTPLGNLFSESLVISVRADSPLKNGRDFVERLRKDPASLALTIGAAALGSANHLAIALVSKAGGVDMKKLKIVVVGSSGVAMTMLLGGHIDAVSGTPSAVAAMVRAGKMRSIGVLAPKRIGGLFAGTPTWTEQGYPALMKTWRGVIGPKGMTAEQVAFWDNVLARAVATELWRQMLEQNDLEANYLNSVHTRRLFEEEYDKYRIILRDLGMLT
jgi:putative tricarboxylic transport membrane protein